MQSLVRLSRCCRQPAISRVVPSNRWATNAAEGVVLDEARDILLKAMTVISAVRPEDYGKVVPKPFDASIGGHIRHCIDHFQKLLSGDCSAVTNYDDRNKSRGGEVERNPVVAKLEIEDLLRILRDLGKDLQLLSQQKTVAFMRGSDFSKYEMSSTLEREISFLVHHTVHHLAMIKLIAATLDYKLEEDLGLAPSTRAAQIGSPLQSVTPPTDPICNPAIQKDHQNVVDTVVINDMGPAGKVVMCRCWRSKKFPHCDGSHVQHNKDSGDNVGPLIIRI